MRLAEGLISSESSQHNSFQLRSGPPPPPLPPVLKCGKLASSSAIIVRLEQLPSPPSGYTLCRRYFLPISVARALSYSYGCTMSEGRSPSSPVTFLSSIC
ncbi:hypothetical protein ACGC1H_003191 [Rhizoctonia solani]